MMDGGEKATPWLTVIGIGDDGLAGLSPSARTLIATAEVIVGGDRHQRMVAETNAERLTWRCGIGSVIAQIVGFRGRRVVVLTTGDPMWFGAGANLARRLPGEEMMVLPHPGAFSLAAARLGWPLADVETLTAHSRPLAMLNRYIQPDARLLVLSRGGDTPAAAAALLTERGFGPSHVTVLEHLGGPGENRRDGIAETWPHPRAADLNILAIHCVAGPGARIWSPVPGLPDDAFVHDGKMTKREVRAAAIAALAPLPGQTLWDVGAGAGSIAIEWLRAAPCYRLATGVKPAPSPSSRTPIAARRSPATPSRWACRSFRSSRARRRGPSLRWIRGRPPFSSAAGCRNPACLRGAGTCCLREVGWSPTRSPWRAPPASRPSTPPTAAIWSASALPGPVRSAG